MSLFDDIMSFFSNSYQSEADKQRAKAAEQQKKQSSGFLSFLLPGYGDDKTSSERDRNCFACRFYNPEGKISENPVPDENGYFYSQVGPVCINKTICRNDNNLPRELNRVYYYPHQHYTRSLCDYFVAGKYDKYGNYEREGY